MDLFRDHISSVIAFLKGIVPTGIIWLSIKLNCSVISAAAEETTPTVSVYVAQEDSLESAVKLIQAPSDT